MILFSILIGLILLFIGHRLFGLFVACVGFAVGYHVARQVFALHSLIVVMAVSILSGILGAVIAIFFQKAAIVAAGFGAGSYMMLSIFGWFSKWPAQMVWLSILVGGMIGIPFGMAELPFSGRKRYSLPIFWGTSHFRTKWCPFRQSAVHAAG